MTVCELNVGLLTGSGMDAGTTRVHVVPCAVADPGADAPTPEHDTVSVSRLIPEKGLNTMPVVLREAMVRGVPVVASRLAGIPESVDDEVGWLVPVDAVDRLAAVLATALADEGHRRATGEAARERALLRWSPERQVRELLPAFGSRHPVGQ